MNHGPALSETETFRQILRGPVWDGDLMSKSQRDLLKEAGFIDHGYGFNYLTTKGVEAAVALGFLKRGAPPLNPVMQSVVDGTFTVGKPTYGIRYPQTGE